MKPYDQMTISEMEEIYIKLGKEIEKRRNAEMREDWRKLVRQIQLFTECYGLIDVQDEKGKLCFIVSDTDFSKPGVIYISEY